MTYEVMLTDEAHRNAEAAYEWYAERSPDAALRWWKAFLAALEALKHQPERFATARESDDLLVTVRQVNFGGGRRRTHRLVYVVRPDRVVVYAVRHHAQRDLKPEDLAQ